MVDIQTVSIVVASAGVFVAAIYYILQKRHQTKIRQTDLVIRLYSAVSSKSFWVRHSPSKRDKRVGIILAILGFVMMLAMVVDLALDIYGDMGGWSVVIGFCGSMLIVAGYLLMGGVYDPYDI